MNLFSVQKNFLKNLKNIYTKAKQIMTLITKESKIEFTKKTFGDFMFVPMLEKKARD
jgi:hypothetical protein